MPALHVDEVPHHLAVLENLPASSRLLRVESLELCTRYMKIFIEVLLTVVVGGSAPKTPPCRGLGLRRLPLALSQAAVPPLFRSEGLTAGSTERCAMLAMQCSAGQCWAPGSAARCATLLAVQRCALYMRCAESKCKRAHLRKAFQGVSILCTSLTSAARFGSRGLPPPSPRFPLRSAYSCGGLAAASTKRGHKLSLIAKRYNCAK